MNIQKIALVILQGHNPEEAPYPGGPNGYCTCGVKLTSGIKSHQAQLIAECLGGEQA